MAAVGCATIKAVPPFGLPKMSSSVGLIANPTFFASPLWSIREKICIPFAVIVRSIRSIVSGTEYLLGFVTTLLPAWAVPANTGAYAKPIQRKPFSNSWRHLMGHLFF